MGVLYVEGTASRNGPESCVSHQSRDGRPGPGPGEKRSTGEHAGRPLMMRSSSIFLSHAAGSPCSKYFQPCRGAGFPIPMGPRPMSPIRFARWRRLTKPRGTMRGIPSAGSLAPRHDLRGRRPRRTVLCRAGGKSKHAGPGRCAGNTACSASPTRSRPGNDETGETAMPHAARSTAAVSALSPKFGTVRRRDRGLQRRCLRSFGISAVLHVPRSADLPCELSTSTCRSFVTISSAACLFLAISSVLHRLISHTSGRTTSGGRPRKP